MCVAVFYNKDRNELVVAVENLLTEEFRAVSSTNPLDIARHDAIRRAVAGATAGPVSSAVGGEKSRP